MSHNPPPPCDRPILAKRLPLWWRDPDLFRSVRFANKKNKIFCLSHFSPEVWLINSIYPPLAGSTPCTLKKFRFPILGCFAVLQINENNLWNFSNKCGKRPATFDDFVATLATNAQRNADHCRYDRRGRHIWSRRFPARHLPLRLVRQTRTEHSGFPMVLQHHSAFGHGLHGHSTDFSYECRRQLWSTDGCGLAGQISQPRRPICWENTGKCRSANFSLVISSATFL